MYGTVIFFFSAMNRFVKSNGLMTEKNYKIELQNVQWWRGHFVHVFFVHQCLATFRILLVYKSIGMHENILHFQCYQLHGMDETSNWIWNFGTVKIYLFFDWFPFMCFSLDDGWWEGEKFKIFIYEIFCGYMSVTNLLVDYEPFVWCVLCRLGIWD